MTPPFADRPVPQYSPPYWQMPPNGAAQLPPPPKRQIGIVITTIALMVGGLLLAWGASMIQRRLHPNYLADAEEAPRLIERTVGCKPCQVERIIVMKDSLVVFMADPKSDHNQLWDIAGVGGFPRDGWELGRGDPEKAFDPRSVDWSRMQSEADDWQKRNRRRAGPGSVNVVRCPDGPQQICFEFR